MKKNLIGILLLLMSLSTFAQQIDQEFLMKKTDRYTKMKRNGLTLGGFGIVTTGIGVILMTQADWTKTTTASGVNYNTNDASGALGIVAIGVGVPLVITGIILSAIGNKKEKEYRNKLNNFSFQVKSNSQITGLSLVYNF